MRLKGLDLRFGAGHLGLKRATGTFPSALGFEYVFVSKNHNGGQEASVMISVRLKGLEPPRLSTREPKSRMSTNSITGAYYIVNAYEKKPIAFAIGFYGAAYEARTRYLHLGKVALYRMS